MLGLSRNIWFGIGGVLLAVVLYVGLSGDGTPDDDKAKVQAGKRKKGRKKKKKDNKASASESGGLGTGKLCAKLDCSEAQLDSFKGMIKEHRKQTSSARRALAEAHAKIAAELAEETLDTAELDDAYAAASEHRQAIDASARGVLESMHGKLSTPQREALAKLVARHGPTVLLSRPSGAPGKAKGKPRGKKGRRKKGKHKGLRLNARQPKAQVDPAPSATSGAAPDEAEAPAEQPETPSPTEPPAPSDSAPAAPDAPPTPAQ